jgi:hypothetical protein
MSSIDGVWNLIKSHKFPVDVHKLDATFYQSNKFRCPMTVPVRIDSIGTPPDRHADRVVSAMLRDLARTHAKQTTLIARLIQTADDNNPKKQKRLVVALEQAGARHVILLPGKRGKYRIYYWDLVGWDVGRNAEVREGDVLPEGANCWLVAFVNEINSRGNGHDMQEIRGRRVLFIGKHVLVRMVQRFKARTPADLMQASHNLLDAFIARNFHADMTAFTPVEQQIEMTQNATLTIKVDPKTETAIATTIY